MTYYFDMDGVLANFHKAYANNKGERVYIQTNAANENGKAGKVEWLAKYIPEVTSERFICIVGHGKKIDYIREDGMLIDDDSKNTKPWEKAGQVAYLLTEKGEAVTL